MYFSSQFDIDPTTVDWFDPILDTDTKLFVDPFLIFNEEVGFWADAHDALITYFRRCYHELAPVAHNKQDDRYRHVVGMMRFPESDEFRLGYAKFMGNGAGTSWKYARLMVDAMVASIDRGLEDLSHFEELGILVKGIDRDRISDITLSILKPRFIEYTQEVCEESGIPLEPIQVRASRFDENREAWVTAEHMLPRNPVKGTAVILVPKRFLRELPTLNAYDWYDYSENALRDDLNRNIQKKVGKEQIVRLARGYPELIRQWSTAREAAEADPYRVDEDPEGIYSWLRHAQAYVSQHPVAFSQPTSPSEVDSLIDQLVREFRTFVEQQGGWRLLWDDAHVKPRREEAVQLLFKGIVQNYCRANGVVIDREVELGRGPVDFVLTKSITDRVLIEVKRMSSGKYWEGMEKQLTSYLTSDNGCGRGFFLAVRYKDTKLEASRTADLAKRTRAASEATGFSLRSAWIDARPKDSASRL